MTNNPPSIILSDSILESHDTKTKLTNTPIHKLNTSFKITADKLTSFNECKERSIRHKSVSLSCKFIKTHLQKKAFITPEECDSLTKSVLQRKKDVCPLIRTQVIQLIGFLILKGKFEYLNLLFLGLNDSNPSTILATLKSIKELIILFKNKEVKEELSQNISLIVEINKRERSKSVKEESASLLFKMYTAGLVTLGVIKHLIHLAPKEVFGRMMDEIIDKKNENKKENLKNRENKKENRKNNKKMKEEGMNEEETKEKEINEENKKGINGENDLSYSFIFQNYTLMTEIFQINPEIFTRINYSEEDLISFLDLIVQKEEDFFGLKIMENINLKNVPLKYFISLIRKNKKEEENLEIILQILSKMEENEEKINLEEKERLICLLIEINKEKDILDYILRYLLKSNNHLFGYFVEKLTKKETVNKIIKYFDISYEEGDIIYQCYKFLWLLMKEERVEMRVYDLPLEKYEELIHFIIFLHNKIKENDPHAKILLRDTSTDFIKVEGNLKEKMSEFLIYLLNYLNKHLIKLSTEEVKGYCKLIEEGLINPNLKVLFTLPLKEIALKPQAIMDNLFVYMEENEALNKLNELKDIKGSVEVFNHLKMWINTEKEDLIKHFIKFISSSEAIFLESKVKNEEIKKALKIKIFKSKNVNDLPEENNASTTFI